MKWFEFYYATSIVFFLLSVITFTVSTILNLPIQIEKATIYMTIASLVNVLVLLMFMVIQLVRDGL